MAKLLKLRRGTTTQHASFTGAEGEVTIDTTKDTAVVHDGSTQGGTPLAKENMSNVSSASIAGRLGTGSIQGTQLENSGVTAGSYGSSSAIPIVTVDAQGLVTAASTTAIDSTTIANGSASVAVSNNGPITSNANHDFSAGIDVTGNITATGNIEISNTQPTLLLTDTNNNDDFSILNQNGIFVIKDETDAASRFYIESDGHTNVTGRLDAEGGLNVSGNITVTGTVDGVDVAALKTSKDSLSTTNGVLLSSVTVPTQPQSNDSTKLATTAYVRTAITEAKPFPTGTAMLFAQTSAPTGWTKSTTHNNKALRVVSGTAGSGGSNAFTTAFGAARGISANAGNTTAGGNVSSSAGNTTAGGNVSVSVGNSTAGGNISVGNTTAGGNVSISSVSTSGTVNSHTLSNAQMPSHGHTIMAVGGTYRNQWRSGSPAGLTTGAKGQTNNGTGGNQTQSYTSQSQGGSQGHSHGFSGSSHSHNGTLSGTAHNHNANFSGSAHNHNASGSFSGTAHNHSVTSNFSGSAHNHSISVGNLDMAVQYVDVIIATKD